MDRSISQGRYVMKVCTKCKEEKPLGEFRIRVSRGNDARHSWCKSCVKGTNKDRSTDKEREYKLKYNFGITMLEYDRMLKDQGSVCKICGNPEVAKSNSGVTKRLAVDHCHDTGKIRGLLCQDCNIGIGKLKDNPVLLQKAMDYLKEGM